MIFHKTKRMNMLLVSLLHGTIIFIQIISVVAFNTDTSDIDILDSPHNNSFFGYSLAATDVDGNLVLWSGLPKFSDGHDSVGSARGGAIYRCLVSKENGLSKQTCEKINLKSSSEEKNDTNASDGRARLQETALEVCPFTNTTCEYTVRSESPEEDVWLTRKQYELPSLSRRVKRVNKASQQLCYHGTQRGTRLTGPPAYTIHEGLIALDADGATKHVRGGQPVISSLISQSVKFEAGVPQCLQFCYNAYSLFDNRRDRSSRRSLRVLLRYENGTTHEVYVYKGPRDVASKYWNFTAINIRSDLGGYYQVEFEVTVYKNNRSHCPVAADIVLNDISVVNHACEDEPDNIDILESEQSVGLNLEIKSDDNQSHTITTCGPLWQKNCGYAKEAVGVCYKMTFNATATAVETIHNPASDGCIRGKIDVVMLVDQSGSVNQCNFQKVKQWLRNIVRGFTVGPDDQDIGIILYSSAENTENVFELGFKKYNNNGTEKKARMLKDLKKLEYPAGATYTGVAFEHANDMLWGPLARKDAKKMVILLTDGDTSKEDKSNLQKQVNITRRNNATILAVGVADYNPSELISISGSARNFFPVKDFSQLELVRVKLRESVSHSVLEGGHDHDSDPASMENCQMGFSIHSGKDSLFMGSPGCHHRAGDVIEYNPGTIGNRSYSNESRYKDEGAYLTTTSSPLTHDSEYLQSTPFETVTLSAHRKEGNRTVSESVDHLHEQKEFLIPSISELERAMGGPLDESYFGYDVTSGYYLGESEGELAAASAPRYLGFGAVLIYRFYQGENLRPAYVLHGRQVGEYFGASVCSLDINADGYTDLFIAAPLHSADNPDEGRVYVYMGGVAMSREPDATLLGSGSSFSRFGTSVNPVGDLNMDGFSDLVVSAPHEEEGKGAVYVFHGGKGESHSKYVQRIAASQFKERLELFGQDVFGYVDVDGNSYPDLIISAPGSDVIVTLRTRPVVHIVPQFSITSREIDTKNELCYQQDSFPEECIVCTACFAYKGTSVNADIVIHYDILADADMLTSRVGFYESMSGERTLQSDVILSEPGMPKCKNHSLYLKTTIQDMMTKVNMRLTLGKEEFIFKRAETVDVKDSNNSATSLLTPVLDIHTMRNINASILFKTQCEMNSSCVADVSVAASGPVNEKGQYVDGYKINEDKMLRFKVEILNSGPETAHAVVITVQYSDTLIYNSLSQTNCLRSMVQLDSVGNGMQVVTMTLRKTLLSEGQKCDGVLIFVASNQLKPAYHDHLAFQVEVTTVSIDNKTENNQMTVKTALKYKANMIISGSAFPSAISYSNSNATNATDSRIELRHVYSISNIGPTTLHGINLTLLWPARVRQLDTFVQVIHIEDELCFKSQIYRCCEQLVATNETLNNGMCSELEKHYDKKSTTQSTTIVVNVQDLPVHRILEISVKGEIASHMLLNLTTQIFIASKLSVSMDHRNLLIFPRDQAFSATAATTVFAQSNAVDHTDDEPAIGLPFWVYILSAGVGLLLLCILILLLRQLGFFKSKYAKMKQEAQEDMLYSSERTPMNVET